ncbi:MAG: SIS domain-containing protein, partial [Streptococcus sp.]
VHLKREVPTVLVSFARSGNSPESVATVDLAKQLVDDLYQITITCAAQGKLAQQAQGDEKNLLLLQPEASNDAGFAMTSSFSSMMLTALLVFDRVELAQKEAKVAALLQLSQDVLGRVADVQQLVDLDFSRVIYLGAGPFFGLAHEAQLKILELTAGQIATMYESPVGFRHGPKSLINQDTVVLVFGSADAYTKAYDLDLVREVAGDGIVRRLVLLTDREEQLEGVEQVVLSTQEPLGDSYRIFPYIVYAQLFALLSSLKVKNRPDTPSPTGTVNRVVQGVIIHSLGQ